jgi:hypothetical protein
MRSKKPYPRRSRYGIIALQPKRVQAESLTNINPRCKNQSGLLEQEHPMDHKRTPDKLPDPWLFDSEKLLRELDRCREMVLLIPAPTHATHFAINIAVDAIWNLTQQLRFLLHLHREGQRSFARQHHANATPQPPLPAGEKPARREKRKRQARIPQAGKAIILTDIHPSIPSIK